MAGERQGKGGNMAGERVGNVKDLKDGPTRDREIYREVMEGETSDLSTREGRTCLGHE